MKVGNVTLRSRGMMIGCRMSCLLAVCALAVSIAGADDNILGLPSKAIENGGTLVICGGGDTPEEVYDEFVRLAGGEKARLVIIPSAYPYGDKEIIRQRFQGWTDYAVEAFDIVDAESREEADTDEFAATLAKATGVWMGGGNQSRLATLYVDTKAEDALRSVLERGGAIGGISAGAAVMSRVMIRQGSAEAVVEKGFGFIENAVIDQHFSQRARHTRLLDVLEKNPGLLGLGVDEGTALVVQGNSLRVMGEARATLFTGLNLNQARLIYRLDPEEEAELVVVGHKAGRTSVELQRKK